MMLSSVPFYNDDMARLISNRAFMQIVTLDAIFSFIRPVFLTSLNNYIFNTQY